MTNSDTRDFKPQRPPHFIFCDLLSAGPVCRLHGIQRPEAFSLYNPNGPSRPHAGRSPGTSLTTTPQPIAGLAEQPQDSRRRACAVPDGSSVQGRDKHAKSGAHSQLRIFMLFGTERSSSVDRSCSTEIKVGRSSLYCILSQTKDDRGHKLP